MAILLAPSPTQRYFTGAVTEEFSGELHHLKSGEGARRAVACYIAALEDDGIRTPELGKGTQACITTTLRIELQANNNCPVPGLEAQILVVAGKYR